MIENPLRKYIPQKIRKPVYTMVGAVVLPALSALGANCDDEQKAEPTLVFEPAITATIPDIEPTLVEQKDTEDPLRFLDYPFEPSADIKVQQTMDYNFDWDHDHNGTDYIWGELDDSDTWMPFIVKSAAEGEACVNPINREGLAVYERHDRPDGGTYFTYYGHLESVVSDIPQCKQPEGWYTEFKHLERGEEIGTAGSSGVKDRDGKAQPKWKHLHFQVNRVVEGGIVPVDPYNINSTREDYPDVLHTNGKFCGPKTLFRNCPIDGRLLVPTREAIPTVEMVQTLEAVPTLELTVKTEVLRPTAIEQKQQEAIAKTIDFMNLMLSGQEMDIDLVFRMQTPQDSRNKFQEQNNPNYYDLDTKQELSDCSREMRDGGLQVLDYKIFQIPRAEKEPSEKNPDLYGVSVSFNFAEFSFVTDQRKNTKTFDHEGLRHTVFFEDVGGKLYISNLFICNSSDTKIHTAR